MTSIGVAIGARSPRLTSITVDGNNKNYSSKDGVLYNKKKTKLIFCPGGKTGSFTIPSSVTSIEAQAFEYSSISSVSIPEGVTSIKEYTFLECANLTSIVLSNGITSIGEGAFEYSCITSIEIPDSVTSIGEYAFYNCERLKDIYYAGTEKQWNKISFGDWWNWLYDDWDGEGLTVFYGIKSVSLKTTSYTYNGSEKKPGVVVKDGDGNTLDHKYYSVSYKNNKKVGTGTVTIKFKNGYSGTATKTFTIKPIGTTLSSVSKGSKSFTVKWKKQSKKMSTSNITGYQIQYSTSSSFSIGNKTVTVSGYTTTSKKVTGLKSGTKYYVRIRTYKSISGTKYYSGWSSAKSVTTK